MNKKRFWISWNQPMDDNGDYRPIGWPLPSEVSHYWCSGTSGDGTTYATLCAIVEAPNEAKAKRIIRSPKLWPDAGTWRFCDEVEPGWMPEPSRFPVNRRCGA